MPQIERWSGLPAAIRDHLVERMHDRNIGLDDLNQSKTTSSCISPRYTGFIYVRGFQDVLPRNVRLPDECTRLGKGRGDAGVRGIPAGGDGGRGGSGAVQHVLDSRQGGAEGFQPAQR